MEGDKESYSLHTLSGVIGLPDGSVYGIPRVMPALGWGCWSDLYLLGEFLSVERPGAEPFEGTEKDLYVVRYDASNRRFIFNRWFREGDETDEVSVDGRVWDVRDPAHRRWLELADHAGADEEVAALLAWSLAPLRYTSFSGFVSFHTGRWHLHSIESMGYALRRDDGAVFVVSPVRYGVCLDRGVVGLESVAEVFLDGRPVRAHHRYFDSLKEGVVDWNEALYAGLLSDPRSVMLDPSCGPSDRTEVYIDVDSGLLCGSVRYGADCRSSSSAMDSFFAERERRATWGIPALPDQVEMIRKHVELCRVGQTS